MPNKTNESKQKENKWINWERKTARPITRLFANLSIFVRTSQFKEFEEKIKPSSATSVLDVGVTSDETLKDSNIFEKLYKYPQKLTAATIEDPEKFECLYPKIKVIKIDPGKKLPFKPKSFDVVVSWATLEHVGSFGKQQDFINELLRVGKKVFITTPSRGALYEPHTGFFFLHWLPLSWFRKISKMLNRNYWSTEDTLNPLWVSDLEKMNLDRKVDFKIYRIFHLLPAHIIITAT